MSEHNHILDPKGRHIPLLDRQGNLSAEAMALYVSDGLSATDRAAVDAVAAQDEMTREALDGLLPVAVNHRAAFTSLNAEIAERTGIATVVHTLRRDIPWLRIAAGVALLLTIGGITYFVSQWTAKEQMAMNDLPEQEISDIPLATGASDEDADKVVLESGAHINTENEISESPQVAIEPPTPAPVNEEPKVLEGRSKIETKKADSKDKAKTDQLPPVVVSKKEKAPDNDAAASVAQQESTVTIANQPKSEPAEPKVVMPATMDGVTTSRQAAKRELQAAAQAEATGAASAGRSDEKEKPMPFDRADSPPRFPGGDLEMLRFINRNRNYPETLKNEGVSGAVYVNFVIEKDGKVGNVKVVQGVNGQLDEDALRVIRAMPRWNPAEQAGSKIPTTRTVIVRYE
ncbi:MAG: TonB family protein [Flavobacteriales bacterium]|nr:TonB family protein [Flavobacteriales bacterium]